MRSRGMFTQHTRPSGSGWPLRLYSQASPPSASLTSCGARSRNFGSSHRSHRSGASTTWESAEMMLYLRPVGLAMDRPLAALSARHYRPARPAPTCSGMLPPEETEMHDLPASPEPAAELERSGRDNAGSGKQPRAGRAPARPGARLRARRGLGAVLRRPRPGRAAHGPVPAARRRDRAHRRAVRGAAGSGRMSDELASLDATAQADLVRRGELTPRELVDAAIDADRAARPAAQRGGRAALRRGARARRARSFRPDRCAASRS